MRNGVRGRREVFSPLILSLLLWVGLTPGQAPAQGLLGDLQFEELVGGLSRPVGVTHAGDGSDRLFITLQAGQIVLYDGSRVLPAPFLDITPLVACCGERGLLGLAFHPRFKDNGFFFVNYYSPSNETVIARYRRSADPNRADPQSAKILLRVPQPFQNHNAGELQFGPDGYLYAAFGDGGSGGDPGNRAQDLSTLLGKILRIDVDNGEPYGIPPGNPFVNQGGARPEIWSSGLRNPWRFSFDRQTGDMFVADVGQNAWEEISFQPAGQGGLNFGWRRMEGNHCFNPSSGCNIGSLRPPILEYAHAQSQCGGAVIGGYRYRGAMYPALRGVYFYADNCTRNLYAATEQSGNWTPIGPRATTISFTAFGEDESGEIYFTNLSPGALYRLEHTAVEPPNGPSINSGGVINAASFSSGPVAPGSIAAVFGLNLSSSEQSAQSIPLPVELGGARLTANGTISAPLFFVMAQQMNAQIPWELPGQGSVGFSAQLGPLASPPVQTQLVAHSPGLFTLTSSGTGQGAVLIAGTGSIAAPEGAYPNSRPALAGEPLAIFGTGFGAVTNQPVTGAGAGAMPLAETISKPIVRIGGIPAQVTFSGLAPGFVGLNQVNAIVPQIASVGSGVEVQLEIAGIQSNTVTVAIGGATQ